MASGLFGALSALGNFGNQLATADDSVAAQRAAKATAEQGRVDRETAAAEKRREFDLKNQAANAKKPLGVPYTAAGGKMMQRFYDPATQKITEEEINGGAPETDAEKMVRSLMAIGQTKDQATKASVAKYGAAAIKPDAGQAKVNLWKSLGFTDAEIKRMEGVEGGLFARPKVAGAGAGGGTLKAPTAIDEYRAKKIQDGTMKLSDVPTKERDGVVNALMLGGMEPGKAETNQEKQSVDAAKQLVPMVNDALKMLENHKNETGLMSSAKQHIANSVYGHGVSPGKDEEEILQTVSFLQLLGVQPWTKTGRGKFIFEQIEPHLPKAGDSLGLTYQKLETLKKLLPSVMSTPGYGESGTANDVDAQILKALEGK